MAGSLKIRGRGKNKNLNILRTKSVFGKVISFHNFFSAFFGEVFKKKRTEVLVLTLTI